jgi:hypothetical protein|eukprot:CAMPEP_0174281192 /NCGR_PEP_ID=MMETSP0809-20121228/1538_1 /TAXON_ID=73025 ORGANISM="Eutreptiella gymnastica-like, Strain CCMP1594" /NCGR_SAMPLE_ID=MMETSP0809 /ASSEMBLY_ACC=CAM_ASM_000658 /LENGTH=127 /DNA_ID=CAMNT_0015374567 /DNA_START=31 /DNA_END=414 /DNA_ORIENTATION=+
MPEAGEIVMGATAVSLSIYALQMFSNFPNVKQQYTKEGTGGLVWAKSARRWFGVGLLNSSIYAATYFFIKDLEAKKALLKANAAAFGTGLLHMLYSCLRAEGMKLDITTIGLQLGLLLGSLYAVKND